jgi:hypothetical protein
MGLLALLLVNKVLLYPSLKCHLHRKDISSLVYLIQLLLATQKMQRPFKPV